MNLTVLGASGGVGRKVVELAHRDGHEVTAVVRDADRAPDRARVVPLDLADAPVAAVASALTDADAVLSCVGAARRSDVGVALRSTRTILAGMESAGVGRLVVISAAPVAGMVSPRSTVAGEDPLTRLVLNPLLRTVLGAAYADLAAMEDELRGSAADWTIVRPPRLTNGPFTGRYRVAVGANLPHGRSVSRADLAHLMLRLPAWPETVRQPVAVASG